MFFAISAPMLLPIPSPIRNTARMIEKVYVLAPNSRLRIRVQMTSAASAQNPDRAIAMYTVATSGFGSATGRRISTRNWASRLESGSSIKKACGLRTIARPMATRWR